MNVVTVPDVAAFAPIASRFLAAQPIEGNVIASAVQAVVDGRLRYDDPLWLVAYDADSQVIGVATHTPPYPVALPRVSATVASAVAAAVADLAVEGRRDVTSVNAPVDAADAFAERWRQLTEVRLHLRHEMRSYRLDAVVPPAGVAGEPRLAGPEDRELVRRWTLDFCADVDLPEDGAVAGVEARMGAGGLWLWTEGGTPVSMAGVLPAAAGVSRVGPVYTPPEHRGHGFGSAVTARASRAALDRGARLCMLFTDLANPTSNAIYQRIGYRAVTDWREYAAS